METLTDIQNSIEDCADRISFVRDSFAGMAPGVSFSEDAFAGLNSILNGIDDDLREIDLLKKGNKVANGLINGEGQNTDGGEKSPCRSS